MLEFVLAGRGTVIIKEEEVAYADIYGVTGWSFTQDEDGIVSVKGNETHEGVNGVHKIFRDTKPLSKIDAVGDLLLQEGVNKNIVEQFCVTTRRESIRSRLLNSIHNLVAVNEQPSSVVL